MSRTLDKTATQIEKLIGKPFQIDAGVGTTIEIGEYGRTTPHQKQLDRPAIPIDGKAPTSWIL
jgi:hypothetical protein